MNNKEITQVSKLIDTSNPQNVIDEIYKIFSYFYPINSFEIINNSYNIILKLFDGNFENYKKCNTEYHDLRHTMDAMLATARLIDGINIGREIIQEQLAVNLLLAALFHDTGYIQETGDDEGTGAKYTKNHVERSVLFVNKNSNRFKIKSEDSLLISKIIRCTGIKIDWDDLKLYREEEKTAGCILGSADMLGQMSDRQYLEKLLFLYYEFKEAGIEGFDTEFDVVRKTVDFYNITKDKLTKIYKSVYKLSQFHFEKRYGIDQDLYMEAIDRQIDYLKKIIDDESTNFRKKLKRIDYSKKFIKPHYNKTRQN